MFDFDNTEHDEVLDDVISDLLRTMKGLDETTDEYKNCTDQLTKLMKIRQDNTKLKHDEVKLEYDNTKLHQDNVKLEHELKSVWYPSPDALVGAAASILGVVAILHFEKLGVITSKALSFVGKMK